MLETWFQTAKEGIAEHSPRPFRWIRILPPGIWIIIAVVALVGGRLHWVNASRPAHRQEIAAAFGSVSLFNGAPQMNQDGSQITYVATGDHGFALFLCDTVTGHKQTVTVPKEDMLPIQVWPWSPDGSWFIYTTRSNLFICPSFGINASNTASIDVHGASDVIWLNPLEFAWLEGETICYAKRPVDGQWAVHRLPHQGRVLSLTAVDAHTIAWLQDDFICRLNLSDDLAGTNNPFVSLNLDAYTTPLTNNLLLWLDASTLQQSNETPVTALADLSSKKNSAIYNRNPPIFNAPDSEDALNGKGTIHFESGESNLDATGLKTSRHLGIAGSQPRSIFAVMRRDAGRSMMLVNIGSTVTNGSFFGLSDQNGGLYLPSGNFRGKNNGTMKKLPNSWHILETVYDGTHCKSYVNGGLRGEVALPFNTVDREVEIGLRTAIRSWTNAAVSDGDFAELLVYNRALSYAERRQVEDYLGVKWFGSRPLSLQDTFVWLDPDMSGLTGFNYSKETGRFLVGRTEYGRDSLLRMESQTGDSTNTSLVMQGRFLRDAQWTGLREFAYTSHELNHSGLVLADLSGSEKDRLFERASISWFKVTPDQKKMLFWGDVSNEPAAGIWRYDLDTGDLQSVVSGSDHPSIYARNLTPFYGSIKLPSGRSVNCVIYPPAHFDRHKKYPLLLGNTVLNDSIYRYQGALWAPAMASCGAYVVIIERGSWFGGVEKWGENVMGVYESLVRDPCIDAQQVYLIGASAETHYMSEFMVKTPGLWKGIIFLNPSGLPDFSKSPLFQSRPEILISAGSEEHEYDRFKKYQADALNDGVMVNYIIHPGEQHHLIGDAAQLERTKAMMHFIFEE